MPLFSKGIAVRLLLLAALCFPVLFTLLSGYISRTHPDIDALLSMRPEFFSQYIDELPWYSFLVGGVSPGAERAIDNGFLLIAAALGFPFLLYLSWRTFNTVECYFLLGRFDVSAVLLSFWCFSYIEYSLIRPETVFGLIFWKMIFDRTSDRGGPRKLDRSLSDNLA